MSFEAGKVGVRKLEIVGSFLPGLFLMQAADQLLPSLKDVEQEEVSGWAGSGGLLDREVAEDGGQFMRMHYVVAKRVYPSKRLDADFKAACVRWEKANEGAFMPRSVKADLKEDLKKAAFADAPVGVDGAQVLFDVEHGVIYTDALSDAWLDRVVMALLKCNVKVRTVSVETLCEKNGVELRDLQPLDIGDGGQKEMFADALGREFLTWLWMKSEKGGSVADVDVLVDGPLVLQTAGGGAVVKKVTLDGEHATFGRETARALLSNKLLTKAKVTLAVNAEKIFDMTLCADGLLLKGVKLPDCESMNAADQVAERLESVGELWDVVDALVTAFAVARSLDLEEQMREWVAEKGTERRDVAAPGKKDFVERGKEAFGNTLNPGGSMSVEMGGKVRVSTPMVDEELIERAVEYLRNGGRAATSSFQRHLKLGYNRSASLVDVLERRGILGPVSDDGHDPREILELPEKAVK